MAGPAEKSAVGVSSIKGVTDNVRPAVSQSWLMAAPPWVKLATIWAVTSAGKAEIPRAVIP